MLPLGINERAEIGTPDNTIGPEQCLLPTMYNGGSFLFVAESYTIPFGEKMLRGLYGHANQHMHIRFIQSHTFKLLVLLLLLTACGGDAAPTATPAPVLPTSPPATNTPAPTATPLPTATPTATPTVTPSPTPTATPTETPTPTATPTLEPTALPTDAPTATAEPPTVEPTAALLTVSFSAEQVRETVLAIASAQGIPLSEDFEVTLEDGVIKIRSVQFIIAAEFETVLWLSIVAEAGEPKVTIAKAELNGAPLADDAVAEFERAIASGFEQGIRQDLAYESVESITIENNLMTVVFR